MPRKRHAGLRADETHLNLDVKVRDKQLLLWSAERKERRDLPAPFPQDEAPLPGDAPFPEMPRLRFDIGWDGALASEADVWVILTQSSCNFTTPGDLGCTVSRSLLKAAPAGSTSTQLLFEQIHPGTYKATAILDRNRNLKTRLLPDSGDRVSLPNQPVTVVPTGESSASARTTMTIPLSPAIRTIQRHRVQCLYQTVHKPVQVGTPPAPTGSREAPRDLLRRA